MLSHPKILTFLPESPCVGGCYCHLRRNLSSSRLLIGHVNIKIYRPIILSVFCVDAKRGVPSAKKNADWECLGWSVEEHI
jgi:hypothetical protein